MAASHPARSGRAALLAALLVLAATLRFTGLGVGLAHPPHIDERLFVENLSAMLEAGDLDHRFYEYPGLFFYLLAPVFLALGLDSPPGVEAYVAARALGAAFGVLSVALGFRLGRRLAGDEAGLAVAAFLALSPLHVRTAHMVRPDVTLEAFALLALLSFAGLDGRRKADLLAGAALGAACAIKFTGALLLVPFLALRWRQPEAIRGVLRSGLAAVFVFAVCSPYALIHAGDFASGAVSQVTHHYREDTGSVGYGAQLLNYAWGWVEILGVPGSLLAPLGVGLALRRAPTAWWPWLAYPLVTWAVLGTSKLLFFRHLIPSSAVIAVLASLALVEVRQRWPRLGLWVGACAFGASASSSALYLRDVQLPDTRDRLAQLLHSTAPSGARVLSTIQELSLGPRVELLTRGRLEVLDAIQARAFEYVVRTPGDENGAFASLRSIRRFDPETPFRGVPLELYESLASSSPWVEVPLREAELDASSNRSRAALVRDQDDESWATLRPQRPGDSLQVLLPEPRRIGRIELSTGALERNVARRLEVWTTTDGQHWTPTRSWPGRAAFESQIAPRSLVLLLEPKLLRGVRLVQTKKGVRRWAVAWLKLFEPAS